MKTKALFVGLLLVATVLPTLSAEEAPPGPWTNLIVNGSFELPLLPANANHYVPPNELFPWQTTDESFEIWASSLTNEQASHGMQHLEILSQTTPAIVWQTVATIPGVDYRLTFYHAARPTVDSTLSVSVNGQMIRTFAENGSALTEFRWRRFGTNFTATSNLTTIEFSDASAFASGSHIDDVVFERLPLASAVRVSEVEVSWESVAGRNYTVQYKNPVTANHWLDLFSGVAGNGTTNIVKDVVPVGQPQKYYRVITAP